MSMAVTGTGGAGMPHGVSGASMSAPPQQRMSNLYNQIDSSGSGSITQAQFNQAFQTLNPPAAFQSAGADAVWNSLDPTGSGSVSQQDFVAGMKDQMVQLRQGSDSASSAAAAQTSTMATASLVNILV